MASEGLMWGTDLIKFLVVVLGRERMWVALRHPENDGQAGRGRNNGVARDACVFGSQGARSGGLGQDA